MLYVRIVAAGGGDPGGHKGGFFFSPSSPPPPTGGRPAGGPGVGLLPRPYREHMDFGLKDKVALVAAGSAGIGFACARELAREGARVFLCSREADHATDAARKIHEETRAEVAGIAADVTNKDQVREFLNLVIERAGKIDIWVPNAGGRPGKLSV